MRRCGSPTSTRARPSSPWPTWRASCRRAPASSRSPARRTCWAPARPVPLIAAAAHERGALVVVDGVHLTAHAPVDVAALGADFYACSPYKFLGPHCGVLAAAPDLLGLALAGEARALARLRARALRAGHAALRAARRHHRRRRLPRRARPDGPRRALGGTRRERLTASLTAVEKHEDRLGTASRRGSRCCPASSCTPAPPPGRRRCCSVPRARPAGRLPVPRGARRQRPRRHLLRAGGLPAARVRRPRLPARRPRPLHRRRRRRPPAGCVGRVPRRYSDPARRLL